LSRLFARVIDVVAAAAPPCVVGMIYSGNAEDGADDPVLAAAVVVAYLFMIFYEFVLLAVCDGQTVGKRLMNIKVVKLDGQPIG
jgi:uncharacterized RDD family membrane protein YckC